MLILFEEIMKCMLKLHCFWCFIQVYRISINRYCESEFGFKSNYDYIIRVQNERWKVICNEYVYYFISDLRKMNKITVFIKLYEQLSIKYSIDIYKYL